jgi:hypothetical protein
MTKSCNNQFTRHVSRTNKFKKKLILKEINIFDQLSRKLAIEYISKA